MEEMEKRKDVEGLIKRLRHRDYHVRLKAATALGNIRDKRAVEPLIEALNDGNFWVQCINANKQWREVYFKKEKCLMYS
jgi:HEAT repeat protein